MENNIITLKNEKGKQEVYRVILAVEENSVMENLVLCTNDKMNSDGNIEVRAIKIDINGKYKSVSKEELDFLNGMLRSLQSEGKKDEK